MFGAVTQSLQTFAHLSEKDLVLFESKLTVCHVRKNEFIVKEGNICRTVYFLLEGSAVHILPSDNGTEAVINLYTKHTWFTDYKSFTSQKPALAFIRAFTDCTLAQIDVFALHELIQHSPVFFQAGRLLELMQYTDITTLVLSPEEKYLQLLKQKPALLHAFPLKLIASYLCIAPETLSRIRKRIR